MIIANSADEREAARRALPKSLFGYIDGGAYAEETLRRNVEDLQAIALRQRVMTDVSSLSMGIDLFGRHWTMPVGLGPVGFSGMFARRGEVQGARAAKAAGIPICLSTLSICPLEEVAEAAGPIWFQLYVIKDRGYLQELLTRAASLGTEVLVLTVDLPVAGARYRDVRTGFSAKLPPVGRLMQALDGLAHPKWLGEVYFGGRPHHFGNLVAAIKEGQVGDFSGWIGRNFDPTVTWKDLDWLRRHWKGPIVIKGVLDPEDACEAVRTGVDGLIVSNHGGRQLDGTPSSISALPGIVEAVDGALPVLMDGGVRSGLDVLKALSLGANACFLGRAWAYALAAGGEAGVARMLKRMRAELRVAMALTGCTDVKKAGPDLLVHS